MGWIRGAVARVMDPIDPFVTTMVAGQEHVFPLERLAVCRIGRAAHSTIVLTESLASREHAMIRRDATGHCILSDSGSRNGTTLNGRPVTSPTRLANGDVIRIGQQELTFRSQPKDVAVAPEEEAAPATMIHLANSLISVLVIDIRGYTVLSREIGEERISAVMSDLFSRAGELLFRKGSWSQKYIGDAVMGVWVHNQPQVTSAELAMIIDTLAELRLIIDPLSRTYALPGPLLFGAAINTGYAQIGNMGSSAISDFTALGDTVNKAFRLETASKELGCDLVIGRATMDYLQPRPSPEMLPPTSQVEVKGYDTPETVYRLMFSDLPRLANLVMTARDGTTVLRPEHGAA